MRQSALARLAPHSENQSSGFWCRKAVGSCVDCRARDCGEPGELGHVVELVELGELEAKLGELEGPGKN